MKDLVQSLHQKYFDHIASVKMSPKKTKMLIERVALVLVSKPDWLGLGDSDLIADPGRPEDSVVIFAELVNSREALDPSNRGKFESLVNGWNRLPTVEDIARFSAEAAGTSVPVPVPATVDTGESSESPESSVSGEADTDASDTSPSGNGEVADGNPVEVNSGVVGGIDGAVASPRGVAEEILGGLGKEVEELKPFLLSECGEIDEASLLSAIERLGEWCRENAQKLRRSSSLEASGAE